MWVPLSAFCSMNRGYVPPLLPWASACCPFPHRGLDGGIDRPVAELEAALLGDLK